MRKEEMKEWLEERKEDLKGGMNDLSVDFASDYDLNTSSYLSDLFNEYADSQVDIYYSDLFEWCKHNYEYVEEAVAEFGIDSRNFDFIEIIRSGQFLYNERQLFEDEKEIAELMVVNYLLNNEEEIEKELEESELEEMIDEVVDDLQRYGRLEDGIDIINKYIKEEEDDDEE